MAQQSEEKSFTEKDFTYIYELTKLNLEEYNIKVDEKYLNFFYMIKRFLQYNDKSCFKNMKIFGGFILNLFLDNFFDTKFIEKGDIDIILPNEKGDIFLDELGLFLDYIGKHNYEITNKGPYLIKIENKMENIKIDLVTKQYGYKLCYYPNLFCIKIHDLIYSMREKINFHEFIQYLDFMKNVSETKKRTMKKYAIVQTLNRNIMFDNSLFSLMILNRSSELDCLIYDIKRLRKMVLKGFNMVPKYSDYFNYRYFNKDNINTEIICFIDMETSSHQEGGEVFLERSCNKHRGCNQWISLNSLIHILEMNKKNIKNTRPIKCACGSLYHMHNLMKV